MSVPLSHGAGLGPGAPRRALRGGLGGPGAWEGLSERARQATRDNAGTLLGPFRERRPPFTRGDVEAIAAPTLLVGAEQSPPVYARTPDALERSSGPSGA
ncbi:hypothetical protein [Craurococcus roseus]|uniref:hypothetical protein n=1 Tax=Craurococcus roseus TaxID=77585 RepID=UPI0031CEDF46